MENNINLLPEEKRKFLRYKCILPINIYLRDDLDNEIIIKTQTKNISEKGAYLKVDKKINLFQRIQAEIFLPTNDGEITLIKVNGIVVRIEKEVSVKGLNRNIAIYFEDISEQDREKIKKYAAEHHLNFFKKIYMKTLEMLK